MRHIMTEWVSSTYFAQNNRYEERMTFLVIKIPNMSYLPEGKRERQRERVSKREGAGGRDENEDQLRR